jgi:hypothetical protein
VCCPVCDEQLSEHEAILRLPCQHVFHHECLMPWLGLNLSHLSPLTSPDTHLCHLLNLCPHTPLGQLVTTVTCLPCVSACVCLYVG